MKKNLRKRLEESQNKYRILANNMSDVVWVIEVETMQYYYISPSCEDLRGYTQEEVMIQNANEILTPKSYELVMSLFKKHYNEYVNGLDPRVRMDLEVFHKDGSTVWIDTSARFFKDDDGPLMILGISRDITDRKKLEAERENLIRDLEFALNEQKRLAKENKVLRGLLPICAECKRIRDENGKWHDLEAYIAERSEATFTHTICPRCTKKLYPELSMLDLEE